MTSLLFVLYATLVILIVTSLLLLFKKEGKRYEKISSFATLSMSVATLAVGISTVNVTKGTEAMEKSLNQPLYSVKIIPNYSEEKSVFAKEEYIITNEGAKTKSKTSVNVSTFIEIEYHEARNNSSRIKKSIPVIYFDGARIVTNNLDGVIEYSEFSSNNNECFYRFYCDALQYEAEHPDVFVTVQRKHYFSFDYVDAYGEKHHIVKTVEHEIDPEEFEKIKNVAEQNANNNIFHIKNLNFDDVFSLLFE